MNLTIIPAIMSIMVRCRYTVVLVVAGLLSGCVTVGLNYSEGEGEKARSLGATVGFSQKLPDVKGLKK